ncbi:MAG TPA: hypothetical protein VN637_04320 [Roseiarcus sp.]|nr:hypothetical protein [Roseiarcus sp.]
MRRAHAYDYVCQTLVSRLAEPMRANCVNRFSPCARELDPGF